MKKNKRNIKNWLFLLVLLLLLFPMLQAKFKIFSVQYLKGAFVATSKPHFSKDGWFSGEYQREMETHVKDSFGFREPFVRLYNQWNYSLYNKANAGGVIIGREGFLYEENYIKATLGLDFIGEDSIRNQVQKLKNISNRLKEKNIDVVVLLAPGKGEFYPDYFPEEYDAVKRQTTNYEVFAKCLNEQNIHLLDFHKWFREMKSTVHQKHKLYSKTGIHWSKYGEYVAMDSLLRYFSHLTNTPFPEMELKEIEFSRKLRDTDNDVWKGLNLLKMFPDYEMSYPIVERKYPERNTTKVLTISDSYYWGMFNHGFSGDYLANGEFWYYFTERFPLHFSNPSLVQDADVMKEIEKNRIVLIICTDANLPRFGFGLLDVTVW